MNTSWARWLEALTDHVDTGAARRFGSITAASAGVPIPLFNQLFVFHVPARDDLATAVSWMSERAVPFWVTVPAPCLDDVAELVAEVGLVMDGESRPGMAVALQDLAEAPSSSVEMVPVTRAGQLEEVAAVTAEAFGAPLEAARTLAPASMLEDDRMRWFVGYVDGQPVACGQLQRTGSVAGVYAIAVREAFRRRGIGEAITWQVLHAGLAAGCEVGVLQASPMGVPVYRRMGFREVVAYHHFVPRT